MAIAVFVELIGEVWIDLYVCRCGQRACGGEVFREPCYLHGSTFSTHGSSLTGRVPPGLIIWWVWGNALVVENLGPSSAAPPFEIGVIRLQGGHETDRPG